MYDENGVFVCSVASLDDVTYPQEMSAEINKGINNPKTGDMVIPGFILAMLTSVSIGVLVSKKKTGNN